jgi:hypothetical protein
LNNAVNLPSKRTKHKNDEKKKLFLLASGRSLTKGAEFGAESGV